MMTFHSSKMLKLAVWLCLFKYYLCAEPAPCNCECPNYDDIDVKQIQFNEQQQCPETCCSTEVPQIDSKIDDMEHKETIKSCGMRNPTGIGLKFFDDNKNEKNEAEYAEFPWMVGIFKEDILLNRSFETIQCGGSLIHPSVVLTAAHCVNGKDEASLKIRAGQWDIEAVQELYPIQKIQVKEYIVHEKYHKGGQFNGIALIFLAKPVTIAPNVNVVCLPPQNQSFDMQRCYAAGWGKNASGEEGEYQTKLKRVDLPIVPRDKCQMELRKTKLGIHFNLHDSFVCAGGERKDADTCEGDGGGPLVCPLPNSQQLLKVKYFQAGIVSWGIGCGKQIPGAYVNVPLFRDWIDEKLLLHGYS